MKVKRKGKYAYKRPTEPDAELGWNQDHSALVIPMAAEQALLRDEEVSFFIKQHKNKYDFMLRAKVPRSSRLVVCDDGIDTPLANTIRYYVCKDGEGELVKIMPPLENQAKTRRIWQGEDRSGNIVEKETFDNSRSNYWKERGYTMTLEEVLPPEPRRIGINTGWRVKICNNINDFCGDIDYDYYVNEAKKLVDPLLEGV